MSVSARFEFRVEGQVALQFREREVRGFDREDTTCRPDTSRKPKSVRADVGSDIKDYAAGNDQLLESADRGALKRAEQINGEINSFPQVQTPLDAPAFRTDAVVPAQNRAPHSNGPVGQASHRDFRLGRENHIRARWLRPLSGKCKRAKNSSL